ncbi:MAG TPA: polyhydroxyalkanoate synthesis regulator DNA-binding domain-containing protein [Thermoanaerobaculia bacterium]|nr:polyhydroxyalkanoate synthesis regulator DNA-binding domain-containing protein [Thermoanaerobaculia bacterium]
MVRLIKRYGSRKLYDTEESRYVSLEEIAKFVRSGQTVQVLDNGTAEDVTTPTLAQVILEEGRSGQRALPSALLHELVRLGGRRLRRGVGQVQNGASSVLQAALERWTPVREAREELDVLRDRLAELEGLLEGLEGADDRNRDAVASPPQAATSRAAGRAPATRRSTTGRRAASRN